MSKKFTVQEFVDLLLEMRSRIEKNGTEIFKRSEDFGFNGDEEVLEEEMRFFSLWIITLASPPNRKIKDMLHDKFQKKYYKNKRESLFKSIDKRYQNYYKAFNLSQENPSNSHIIGSVMVEIILNQNSNFSLDNEVPTVSDLKSNKAFNFFHSSFKSIMEEIKRIRKDYEIDHLINDR